jgi:hypothetical protein
VTVPINADNPLVSELVRTRRRSYSERFFDSLASGPVTGEVDLINTSGGLTLHASVQKYKDGKGWRKYIYAYVCISTHAETFHLF